MDVGGLGRGVHLGEDLLGERLLDSAGGRALALCTVAMGLGRERGMCGCAYWKRVAEPPASSMPFFSASASWRMWPYME